MSLEVQGMSTGYGRLTVVHEATLSVRPGEVVAILGPNGAGKSSLMKAIAGSLPISRGSVVFDGTDLGSIPQNRVAGLGIGYVPQRGNVFPDLSVEENLRVSWRGSQSALAGALAEVYRDFVRLDERRDQSANTLSGGERQMLAIACATLSKPSLLMLDEPTTGLAPIVVRDRIRDIERLRSTGTAILWVIEEHPRICLPAVDRVHFMSDGNLGPATQASELLAEGALEELFFGLAS